VRLLERYSSPEPDGNCQGVADIFRMIASEGDPEIVRIRAALAQA
jgi:hypothetical protein